MVKYYRTDDRKIHEEPTIQDGVWVQMVTQRRGGQMVADALDMDVEDVLAALDEEESFPYRTTGWLYSHSGRYPVDRDPS